MMTQSEFIRQLEEALRGNVSERVVRENVDYYDGYISAQLAGGRTLEDVLGSLGNPRLIAKTIIDTSDPQEQESFQNEGAERWSFSWVKQNVHDNWVWKLATVIVVLMVVFLLLKLILGVIGFLFKPAVVVLAIVAVYYLVMNIRKDK